MCFQEVKNKKINSVINLKRVTHFRLCLLETQVASLNILETRYTTAICLSYLLNSWHSSTRNTTQGLRKLH